MKNFDYFGVMIDCSRNAVPSVSGLKKFFDIISAMGYNCAMLYTEDTYEVEGEPFFGYKRGKYSAEELCELDSYAQSKGIELIPCIQTLAHLNAIFDWKEYQPIRDIDDVLALDLDRTYELIERMISSVSKNIRSRKLHIGMDEAHHIGLGKYLDRNGYGDRYEILLRHLERVCDIAKAHGYEVLMWEDMFFRLMQNGDYRTDEIIDFPTEITSKIPSNCSMVYWDYYGNRKEIYESMIISSKKLSDNVWFAGGTWIWGGFMPHCSYSAFRNKLAIKACIEGGVRNAIFTMWGDNGGECPYFSALGMLMQAAAIAEGLTDEQAQKRFREITGEDLDAFLKLELPNFIYGKDVTVGTANYSKNRLYDDPFLAIMSTNSGKTDTSIFTEYAKIFREYADKSVSFAFLFETAEALCRCLAVKFDLPERTRALYAKDDKEGLKNLAEKDYTECIALIEKFYAAFRKQWYASNKTYGFEIQDIRLGGLIMRMKNCRQTLLEYASGSIPSIEELLEDVYEYPDGNVPYDRSVSANIK